MSNTKVEDNNHVSSINTGNISVSDAYLSIINLKYLINTWEVPIMYLSIPIKKFLELNAEK